jgi:glutamate synthase domain-containing protein 3
MLAVSQLKREATLELDARGVPYKELNRRIRRAVEEGVRRLKLTGINGQRYLATGIEVALEMDVYGVPGQDLAAFMKGPSLRVHNNAQDGVGNTMDSGKVTVWGMAGDVIGYGMRGGKIHILGDVGYRVGIHMKAYQEKVPVIVVGGRAGDFLGEYMAGGAIIVLGLEEDGGRPLVGDFVGTGMHGGVIYLRGKVEPWRLGAGLHLCELNAEDHLFLASAIGEFAADFGRDPEAMLTGHFHKIAPASCRPYGSMYAY